MTNVNATTATAAAAATTSHAGGLSRDNAAFLSFIESRTWYWTTVLKNHIKPTHKENVKGGNNTTTINTNLTFTKTKKKNKIYHH